ncbi:glycosyltransferase [Paenibacillus sp. GCM10012307]|uniref:Glycosyltransferase n=1 Tax=Paenibacillus roseus TaxID=2798579 RepID=A0A934JA27_9BACL|nr:glycosyltransferase [Paenibacillus roseus]MBJ6363043.1 glycosyltransferase [Paenibacillus roseus]
MAVILFPPIIDWSFMKQRPHQLMFHLAQAGHHVYFCNKSISVRENEQIAERLFVVHNHSQWLQDIWPSIRQGASGGTLIWCSLPQLAESLKRYQADYIVYDCVDEFAELAPYEPQMVETADWIICTSERLYSRLRRQNPKRPLALVRNGYDSGMGLHLMDEQSSTEADRIAFAGDSHVGYIGAWAPWTDANLLRRLARRLPVDTRLVIIGPEFGRKYGQETDMQFLGHKPHHELPMHIRQMAVLLIPFLPSPTTLATNPVKAYEYLASGKPVVSTALPECMRMQPHVDVCRSADEFIDTVLLRLQDPGDAAARIRYALEHTWEARVREIQAFIPLL